MNEKFVINIGRQLGSGGKAVGERLAERFGIPVYDKRLIKMAAEHSGFGIRIKTGRIISACNYFDRTFSCCRLQRSACHRNICSHI